jgi:SAM-dependent methyltransferase
MLAAAHAKPGADVIAWIEADMRAFDLRRQFDVIVLTGHAFQVLLSDADISAALACFAKHLAPGGRLMFETRNPQAEEWLMWTRERTTMLLEHPQLGPVEVCWLGHLTPEAEMIDVAGHFHFKRSGVRKVSNSRLRFAAQAALEQFLKEAGFDAQTWFGDWDKSSVVQSSTELIVVAQRSGGH